MSIEKNSFEDKIEKLKRVDTDSMTVEKIENVIDIPLDPETKSLLKLYDSTHKEIEEYEHPELGKLSIKYVKIQSQTIPDTLREKYGNVFGIKVGPRGLISRIYLCEDQINEEYKKFNKYLLIHEASEMKSNHMKAIIDELTAAEHDLNESEYRQYCRYRFKEFGFDEKDISELEENNILSEKTIKIFKDILKEYK